MWAELVVEEVGSEAGGAVIVMPSWRAEIHLGLRCPLSLLSSSWGDCGGFLGDTREIWRWLGPVSGTWDLCSHGCCVWRSGTQLRMCRRRLEERVPGRAEGPRGSQP